MDTPYRNENGREQEPAGDFQQAIAPLSEIASSLTRDYQDTMKALRSMAESVIDGTKIVLGQLPFEITDLTKDNPEAAQQEGDRGQAPAKRQPVKPTDKEQTAKDNRADPRERPGESDRRKQTDNTEELARSDDEKGNRTKQLIEQLDDPKFKVREEASKELSGDFANSLPALLKSLDGKLSLEQRSRVNKIIQEKQSFYKGLPLEQFMERPDHFAKDGKYPWMLDKMDKLKEAGQLEKSQEEMRALLRASNSPHLNVPEGAQDAFKENLGRQIKELGATNAIQNFEKQIASVDSLDLSSSEHANEALWHLSGFPNLKNLNLRGSNAAEGSLVHLEKLSNLTQLDLYDTNISDEDMSSLKKLTKLEKLELSNTAISDSGLAALKDSTELQNLRLWNTDVTDNGLSHLKNLTKLSELDLASTLVTGKGLADLSGLPKLETLNLFSSSLTDEGMAGLENLDKLTMLYIGNTKITDAGLGHLEELNSLRHVYLNSTDVTDKGIEGLNKALPKLDIRR